MIQIKKDIETLKVLYNEENNNCIANDIYLAILLLFEKLQSYEERF